jgi:hypothetical protein
MASLGPGNVFCQTLEVARIARDQFVRLRFLRNQGVQNTFSRAAVSLLGHRLADGLAVEGISGRKFEKQPATPFDQLGDDPPGSGFWNHRNEFYCPVQVWFVRKNLARQRLWEPDPLPVIHGQRLHMGKFPLMALHFKSFFRGRENARPHSHPLPPRRERLKHKFRALHPEPERLVYEAACVAPPTHALFVTIRMANKCSAPCQCA